MNPYMFRSVLLAIAIGIALAFLLASCELRADIKSEPAKKIDCPNGEWLPDAGQKTTKHNGDRT